MTPVENVYSVIKPVGAIIPLVIDSPHSGRNYPDDFGYSIAFDQLRSAEDAYVDVLCEEAPGVGATFLHANFPRAYVDPNREEDDIHPHFVDGDYGQPLRPGPKSELGIGLVRQLLASGDHIYSRQLLPCEFQHRIECYYRPYHAQLADLIDTYQQRYGVVWHLDMHSMASHGNAVTPDKQGPRQYDIVLGDLDGTSCTPAFTQHVREVLGAQGLRVRVNDPYKGAAITRRYGNPVQHRHSLQIEINRALYLDEKRTVLSDGYRPLKRALNTLFEHTAKWIADTPR